MYVCVCVCHEQNAGQNCNVQLLNKSSENVNKAKDLWNVTNKSVLHSPD